MTLQPHSAGPPRKRPLSVGDYHRMLDAGVVGPDERVELLEGELIEMSPHGPPHATIIAVLTRALVRQVPAGWTVRVQLPLTIPPDSEPEPDLAIAPGSEAQYRDEHPRTAALAVEVASSSLGLDRDKARLYARADVDEYWLVNVGGRSVEVYRSPDPEAARYRTMETLTPGDTLRLLALPEVTVPIADLFS